MVKGFAGKILRANLTRRSISVDEPDEGFYRRYLGGAGFVSYFLLKELPGGIDPLGPLNKLVFAVGPMTGLPLGGATRDCAGARSPLTGGGIKSEAGGIWPMEFKRTGYDALIVEGAADEPVYLWINPEGAVEIRDARHLWGLDVLQTHEAITRELGDPRIKTTAIGVGGEHLVRYATVMNDLKDAHGRGGLGAVMGSKKLKAIAVRGTKAPEVAQPERIKEFVKWFGANFYEFKTFGKGFTDLGTGAAMEMFNETGNLPSYNFAEGYFDATPEISPKAIANSIRVGMEGCAACPVRCKRVVEFDEPYRVTRELGAPEYETLGTFGSMLGIGDLKAICRANQMANLLAIDTVSAGTTIAFAMECFENGLLTTADTDGLELRFGNADALLKLLPMIANRQGFGDLLAEGSRIAARRIGRGAEQFAMQVKGLEMPMHDPRFKQGMGLVYAVDASGADHCAGIHDSNFTRETGPMEHLRGWGAIDPVPVNDLSPAKVALTRAEFLRNTICDTLVCCIFVPWTATRLAAIVQAVTDWEITVLELGQVAERIGTMRRLYNLREGITAAEDRLPDRFFTGTRRGALKDTPIDREAMQTAIHNWYSSMGWDRETGVPESWKLDALGLSWANDAMKHVSAEEEKPREAL
jgi:aldehyde:ferredoxin oxidoreductase